MSKTPYTKIFKGKLGMISTTHIKKVNVLNMNIGL